MGVAETKIYPINTGWLEADLGTYIFWKGPAGKKYWNPVYCHYVDTGDQKILIDTGLPDEARATKWHHKCEKRGCLQVHPPALGPRSEHERVQERPLYRPKRRNRNGL